MDELIQYMNVPAGHLWVNGRWKNCSTWKNDLNRLMNQCSFSFVIPLPRLKQLIRQATRGRIMYGSGSFKFLNQSTPASERSVFSKAIFLTLMIMMMNTGIWNRLQKQNLVRFVPVQWAKSQNALNASHDLLNIWSLPKTFPMLDLECFHIWVTNLRLLDASDILLMRTIYLIIRGAITNLTPNPSMMIYGIQGIQVKAWNLIIYAAVMANTGDNHAQNIGKV